MTDKLSLCFIDDDRDFEIPLFLEAFSDQATEIVTGTTLQELLPELMAKPPDLFVLDLYFPTEEPDWAALAELERTSLTLRPDKGSLFTAYNNYQLAENRYIQVANALRQSADGGLELAATVTARFPQVPIVFYSRKATFRDVVRCMASPNVHRVIKKPGGANKDEVRATTQLNAARLRDEFRSVVTISRLPESQPQWLGHTRDAAVLLLKVLKRFFLDDL